MLGLDSIQVMEMVAFLEERLGIRIPDDELAEIVTIDDLNAAIQRHRTA
jgi:acyl carrier protein